MQVIERGQKSLLNPLTQQQVLLICREALTNVGKHANATYTKVEVWWAPETLSVSVNDDGCGFDLKNLSSSYGFQIMRDRAAQIGGILMVESHPKQGTHVTLQVPLSLS